MIHANKYYISESDAKCAPDSFQGSYSVVLSGLRFHPPTKSTGQHLWEKDMDLLQKGFLHNTVCMEQLHTQNSCHYSL